MGSISFSVKGEPKGQPRPKMWAKNGRVGVVSTPAKSPIAAWKSDIYNMAERETPIQPIEGSVAVGMMFFLKRPQSHFGTGKNADKLKLSAPLLPLKKPDLDNLAKPVLDVLTRLGYWNDDCQVTCWRAEKKWADKRDWGPGVRVNITWEGDGR